MPQAEEKIQKFYCSNKKLAGNFHSLYLEWYPNPTKVTPKCKLRVPNNKTTKRAIAQKSYIFTASLILLIIQVYLLQPTNTSSSTKIFAWFAVCLLLTFYIYSQLLQLKTSELAEYINSLIEFDLRYSKPLKTLKEHHFSEMIPIYLLRLGWLTSNLFPICFTFGIHWLNPWKPSLIGYWLIPRKCSAFKFVAKFFVCFFNFWIWSMGTHPTMFGVAVVQMLTSAILMDNLKLFKARFYNRRNVNDPSHSIIYRRIQLLTGMLNGIQQGPLLQFMIAAGVVIPAVSFAGLLEGATQDTLSIVVLAYFSIVGLSVTSYIFYGMSKINVNSKTLLETILKKKRSGLLPKEQKWEERFYRSCAPLKAMINSTNFVDELFPLNMVYTCSQICYNILLLM